MKRKERDLLFYIDVCVVCLCVCLFYSIQSLKGGEEKNCTVVDGGREEGWRSSIYITSPTMLCVNLYMSITTLKRNKKQKYTYPAKEEGTRGRG